MKTGRYTLVNAAGTPVQGFEKGTIGGYRRGRYKIYGRLDCKNALRHIARGDYVKYRVFFLDEDTAIAAGFRPCFHCMRDKYKIWKLSKQRRP